MPRASGASRRTTARASAKDETNSMAVTNTTVRPYHCPPKMAGCRASRKPETYSPCQLL